MRNTSIVFAGLAFTSLGALLCTDAALAQSAGPQTGIYLGLGLGKSHARFKTDDFTAGDPTIAESTDTTDTGYKAFIGWQFNRYIAAELAYASLGRYKYTYTNAAMQSSSVNYDANAVALSGVFNIPVANDWSLLLRAGVSANMAERSGLSGSLTSNPPVGRTEKTKASAMGGAGVQYDIARNASVRLEFEYYGTFGEQKGPGIQSGTANFPDSTGRSNIYLYGISGVMRF
jgi:OOP family OmpA-OmpF porin